MICNSEVEYNVTKEGCGFNSLGRINVEFHVENENLCKKKKSELTVIYFIGLK